MGTHVAPTYAIIFMNEFEKKYIYNYHHSPRIWYRFIDDIWGVFKGTESELLEFFDYCNSVHQTIKFTHSYSKNRVNFLDVWTYRYGSAIETTLFVKETDTKSYLDYGSCHPVHVKNSIPYSQFLRIRRNCSKWTEFAKHAMQLSIYLSLRGYPCDLIKNALLKACNKEKKTIQTNSKSLYLVLDYNPNLPDLKSKLLEYWKILDRSSGTRDLLEYSITISYRKPKSLLDLLCQTDVRLQDPKSKKQEICSRPGKCKHCPKLNKTGRVTSTATNRKYRCPKK